MPAANTLSFTVSNVGQVLGPLLAGVFISFRHGFAYAYALDALLFTTALYSALRLPAMPPTGERSRPGLRAVVEGLGFIARRQVLVMSFAVDIVAMVLAMPRSLFPAVAAQRFHGTVGPLYAAIAHRLGRRGRSPADGSAGSAGRAARWCSRSSGGAIAVALSGLAHQLWLVVLLLAVAGAADLVSAVYRQTILQTYAPDELRGRMQGVFVAVVAGGPRLGDVRAGGMAAATGVQFSWVAGGLSCVVVVLVLGLSARKFWRYETPREARAQ